MILDIVLAMATLTVSVGVLVLVRSKAVNHKVEGLFVYLVGLTVIMIIAAIMGGQPTGESLDVLPPIGTYQAKIILIGKDGELYQNEIFIMLWLPERKYGAFQNPQPIKVYRISKDRFVDPKKAIVSGEMVQAVVFYSPEDKKRMIKISPQAP